MSSSTKQFIDWADKLSVRERLILAAVGCAFIWLLWMILFYSAIDKQQQKMVSGIESEKQKIQEYELQKQEILNKYNENPNTKTEQKIEVLKKQIEQLDKELEEISVGMIDPREMTKVLEELLKGRKTLELIKIETLPVSSLVEEVPNETSAAKVTDVDPAIRQGSIASGNPVPVGMGDLQVGGDPLEVAIYKHALRMELEGDYFEVVKYLKAVESLEWRIYWDSIDYEVIKYPKAKVVLEIYTLSTEEGWIGV